MTGMSQRETEWRAGIAALQRGDARTARTLFESVALSGPATPQLWLFLAQSCELLGDRVAQEAAADGVLETDNRNLYALVMKGDCAAARADERAAASFYGFALQVATAATDLPADLIERLRKAGDAYTAATARFGPALHASLSARGITADVRTPRFREALELMEGKREIYFQAPTSFFYPGLPHIQFYDPADFPWFAPMVAAVPAMTAELRGLMAGAAGMEPYLRPTRDRPHRDHSLYNDPKWSAFHLWENGAPVAVNADRCPATMAALAHAPIPQIPGRSPMALFSVLLPHTHIPPHHGMINTRLICHIPLIVPDNCRLRVGNETRPVVAGVPMIFDDSIEHEAWNDSDAPRLILLFEVWRPELTATERAELMVLFEAINLYSGN
jgi:aspartyl/asparaginyl beta-hydroxylase (cupin superfamily)